MPSTRGMRTSMSSTSALPARAMLTASTPSAPWAVTSRSGSAPMTAANPERMSSSSSISAMRSGVSILCLSSGVLQGDEGAHEPAPALAPGGDGAADDGRPLPHADQAPAAPARARRSRRRALDEEAHRVLGHDHLEAGLRPVGVTQHVRQRLLHDPVRSEERRGG